MIMIFYDDWSSYGSIKLVRLMRRFYKTKVPGLEQTFLIAET